MRWAFLGIAVCGFASLWGAGPEHGLLLAFLVMFVNFATFCLLYDRPRERARLRVTEQMRHLHPNSDPAHRLSTAPVTTSAEDRRLGLSPMTILNLATGVAGIGLLAWGLALRAF
jgi:hypothetical protein